MAAWRNMLNLFRIPTASCVMLTGRRSRYPSLVMYRLATCARVKSHEAKPAVKFICAASGLCASCCLLASCQSSVNDSNCTYMN